MLLEGWLLGKDPAAGKDWWQEEKGMTENEIPWMASPAQWTWVWANSGRSQRTGKPGILQSMGLQRVGYNLATKQQPYPIKWKLLSCVQLFATPWTTQSMDFSRPEYWSGGLSLLQGILPTQGSNPGLPHCRRILYQLSHKGSPYPIKRNSKNRKQEVENYWRNYQQTIMKFQKSRD